MRQINLLPKPKQVELRYEAVFRSLVSFVKVAVLTFILVFAAQFLIKLNLTQSRSSLEGKIEDIKKVSNKQENAQLKTRITALNNEITDYKNLGDTTPAWSRVMTALVKDVPDGVKISQAQGDAHLKEL